MGFKDCLMSALEQGALSRDEAQRLSDMFDEEFAQASLDMPAGAAGAHAKARMEEALRKESIEAARRAKLAANARARLKSDITGFRDLKGRADVFGAVLNKFEHHGLGGVTTVTGRAKAIVTLAQAQLTDVMTTFRRSRITGRRFNKPQAENLVRELFGEASEDASARALASPVAQVFETLRQRFNAAGGAIGKLDGFGLPQSHDPGALLRAGKTPALARRSWKDFITPLLDIDRMRDPLTGDRLTAAGLDRMLTHVWGSIATDGMNTLKPSPQRAGLGAVATQRADHRLLHFRNADAWLTYARAYGEPDPIKAVFDHINGMAADIAAMEELGPNPTGTVEWLKQVVQAEAAKSIEGKPSLYKGGALDKVRDDIGYIPHRIEAVWQGVRGGNKASARLATGVSNLRNILTSAQLGAASVMAATTDPFFDAFARHMSGLPVLKSFGVILKTYSEGRAEQAARAGLGIDDFLHTLQEGARYQGLLGGSEWSKWLVDRTMQLSALEPMTQARRHAFGLDFMGALADMADRDLSQVDPMLGRWMQGYGIGEAEWDVIRKTPQFRTEAGAAGLLRPVDVAAQEGGQDAAERLLMMISGQTERAVPTGTVRAGSYLTGVAQRGTLGGELLQSFLQYKSFGLSLTTLQLEAIALELNLSKARGIGYAASLLGVMTLGGALGMQLRHITTGKDPQPMDSPKFWLAAAQAGGGFGIFGDFLFADTSRFGHSMTTTLAGPTMGFLEDSFKLTLGNAGEAARGERMQAGRDLIGYAGRYTPVMSSLWYERLAYRRMVLDQLTYLSDPQAGKRFRTMERTSQRETGQRYWWRPGAPLPERLPAGN